MGLTHAHPALSRTPLLALVDGDPYGLDILSVYKFGSMQMRHESESLVAKRVEWLGLWASELVEYAPSLQPYQTLKVLTATSRLGVDRTALIPTTPHDVKKASH